MASMSATGVPVSGSNATITPWWVGSVDPAFRGKRDTSLTASAFAEGRKAGMAATIPSWSATRAAMRWGIEAAPVVASTMAAAMASTRASRSSSSRTWASVRISIARRLAPQIASYEHDPVLHGRRDVGVGGQETDLAEGVGIKEPRDPLSSRVLALAMLLGDGRRAAHGERALTTGAKLIDQLLHPHGRSARASSDRLRAGAGPRRRGSRRPCRWTA